MLWIPLGGQRVIGVLPVHQAGAIRLPGSMESRHRQGILTGRILTQHWPERSSPSGVDLGRWRGWEGAAGVKVGEDGRDRHVTQGRIVAGAAFLPSEVAPLPGFPGGLQEPRVVHVVEGLFEQQTEVIVHQRVEGLPALPPPLHQPEVP